MAGCRRAQALPGIAQLTEPLVSGSYLVLSHATEDGRGEAADTGKQRFQRSGIDLSPRTHAEVEALPAAPR